MLNKINISPNRQKLIGYLVFTVVTFAVFWQVNQYDFVNIDDTYYVTENFHIKWNHTGRISLGIQHKTCRFLAPCGVAV